MNKKNVQLYASLAEIVSAAAIIVSLLYVAYEFKRTETLSSNEVDLIVFERVRDANSMLVNNSELADLVIRASRQPDDLTEAERLRYLAYQHIFFDSWEIAWMYHEDGILEEPTWQEWDEWFIGEAKRRPAFGWTENRHNFTGEPFLRHVDANVLND